MLQAGQLSQRRALLQSGDDLLPAPSFPAIPITICSDSACSTFDCVVSHAPVILHFHACANISFAHGDAWQLITTLFSGIIGGCLPDDGYGHFMLAAF